MKFNFLRLLPAAVIFFTAFQTYGSNPAGSLSIGNWNGADYKNGVMVVRVKPEFKPFCTESSVDVPAFNESLIRIGATSVRMKYPYLKETSQLNRHGRKPVDMKMIYEITFAEGIKMETAVASMMASGVTQYAEPLFIHYTNYTPNDPDITSQYHLGKINAYNAWDVWKGDTNIVIGIVDSGTDWDHPDLEDNIKYNYNDPIDGTDNDNDGFVDNFRGWDVSMNDNNPMVASSSHGSHVSGCAAATTDNGIGVASPAFNCKFLPVKASNDASFTSIDNGYDGVVYAADHGAHVINCSWGRGGNPSSFEQDIINYATLDKDALVVAASGNDGLETEHYPASYKLVTSVASTTSSDSKSSFSNYGFSIDVAAPGSNIFSTVSNDSYTSNSGTSMASPVAAGCAAMIKARFPWMNALQVGAQLRATSDVIITAGLLFGKMGHGRVNLFKAVTDSLTPGVAVTQTMVTDGNDNVFVEGDTLDISAVFKNFLHPTANLNCSLIALSSSVQILNNSFNGGVVNTLDSVINNVNPYRVVINPGTPMNTDVTFRILMSDGTWADHYSFVLTVNVDYINITVNDISTSITSKGLIGYNQSGQAQGLGFRYQGSDTTILYEMGLMVGAQGTQVSDNVRGDGATYDTDFANFVTVSGQSPGVISDYDAYGVFRDDGSTSSSPLNLLITHRAFAWSNPPDNKYVIVQYSIKNNGGSALNNLYAGLFADWDIPQYGNNKASVDVTRRMGYIWSTDQNGLYGGIKLLSNTAGFNHYAIDNFTGGGGADLSDGYSSAEKYTTLSTSRPDAGTGTSTGNDVIHVVSTGPVNLNPGDSLIAGFALIAGEDLPMIQDAADNAQIKYDNLLAGIEQIAGSDETGIERLFPNPASGEFRLTFSNGSYNMTEVFITDVTGRHIKNCLSENLGMGKYTLVTDIRDLSEGMYFVSFRSGNFTETLPLQLVK